jgi:hypothetical protein
MNTMQFLVTVVALVGAASTALGQSGGETEKRGSIPIGTSRDGSGPSDGAIVGGSIRPSTNAGNTPQRAVDRCRELTGTLREECIRDLGAGAPSVVQADALPIPAVNEIYADPRRRRK